MGTAGRERPHAAPALLSALRIASTRVSEAKGFGFSEVTPTGFGLRARIIIYTTTGPNFAVCKKGL